MAYAYLITGSEDGTIAICGNRKRAIELAIEYVSKHDTVADRSDDKYGNSSIYGTRLSAYVERWWME